MSEQHELAIDPDDQRSAAGLPANPIEAPAQESAPGSDLALSPKVVIHYRNRGLHTAFLPPLLILLAAAVITSYQRQARLRPLAPHAPSTKAADRATSAGRGRQIMVEGSGTGVAIEPIMVRSTIPPPPQPLPAPSAAADPALPPVMPSEPKAEALLAQAENPLEPGPFSPLDLDARHGQPPPPSEPGSEIAAEPPLEPPAPLTSATKEDLPADSPELAFRVGERPLAGQAPEGLADPKVTKEQILQGIRVEADQKQAEQKNLEREMAQSKIREYMEVFRKIQADRPLFHDDLRRLLRGSREGVGEGIEELCDRYGRNLLPEVKKAVVGVSKRSAARLNRGPRIEMLRLYGVPEPAILDSLTKEMELKINTRGGPRDRNDALILAAYLLIKYPPASATSSSPPNAKADRTPAAPRSVVGVAAPPVPRAVRSPQ